MQRSIQSESTKGSSYHLTITHWFHLDEPNYGRALQHGYLRTKSEHIISISVDYKGTDTHGIRHIRGPSVLPIIRKCNSSYGIFDTELILRCEKEGLHIIEIPFDIKEIRKQRNPMILKIVRNVYRLFFIIINKIGKKYQ